MDFNIIIVSALSLLVGLGIGLVFLFLQQSKERKKREKEADEILEGARARAKEIKLTAKGEAKAIIREEKEQLENEYRNKSKQLGEQERELSKKEVQLDQKRDDLQKQIDKNKSIELDLTEKGKKIDEQLQKFKKTEETYTEKLLQVTNMTKEDVKKELVEIFTEEAKVHAAQVIRQIEDDAKEESEKRAKRILGIAIQRFAGEYVAEQTISSVELPSDEIKGRLIGREGRNIRAFEQICGVDLVIDDTPGVVVISSFNVARKEIARLTIERLL